jgi:hypothetical protein
VGWSKPMKTNTLPQLDNPPTWGISFTYYKKKKGYSHVPEENNQTNNLRRSYERNPLMAHGEESLLRRVKDRNSLLLKTTHKWPIRSNAVSIRGIDGRRSLYD